MKILIISDSHGNSNNINKILSKENFDYLFFLGDGLSDLGGLINLDNVITIKGNCDLFSNNEVEKIVKLKNKTFLATHGHLYNVKSGLGGLISYAKSVKADVVLFGHTHKNFYEIIDNIVFINPGSLSNVRGGKQTYAVLNFDENKINVKILQI